MKLIIIRHTEVPSNVNYIVSGRSNESLTPRGIKQAEVIRDELQKYDYDMIFSSPVNRAVETANIINYKGLPVIQDERIIERNPGTLVGKDRSLVNKDEWNSMDTPVTKDGAETLLAIINRVNDFIKYLKANYNDKTIVIVTHNSISRAFWMLKDSRPKTKEEINSYYHQQSKIDIYDDIEQ